MVLLQCTISFQNVYKTWNLNLFRPKHPFQLSYRLKIVHTAVLGVNSQVDGATEKWIVGKSHFVKFEFNLNFGRISRIVAALSLYIL